MKPTHSFIVTTKHTGTRLDQFLATQLPDITRSQIQKYIKAKAVLYNEKIGAKNTRVEEGATVSIDLDHNITPETIVKTIEDSTHLVPTIIAETDEYIVVDKPSGLLVHPTDHQEPYTLMHWLLKTHPKVATVGESYRAGIVHRLDKEVSGVLVLCKTQTMFEHLKKQFKSRQVQKQYIALVHGVLPEEIGDITWPIARSASAGKMAARPNSQGGKPAHTHFEVIKHLPHHTLVHAFPKTGRTHQIRVHFFALGYPIVGDQLYTQKKFARDKIAKQTSRILLHSSSLTFTDLQGEAKTFTSPLPEEFDGIIQNL